MRHLFFVLFCTFLVARISAQPSLRVEKTDMSHCKYQAPLVDEKTLNWKRIPNLFSAEFGQKKTTAWCKVAVSAQNLLFLIEVTDDIHYNPQNTANIWMGDGIQLSIDARGDTTQGMPSATRATFGPDDNALGFAIARGKPTAIVWTGQMRNTYAQTDYTISRDDKRKITRYEVRLPWKKLETEPFAYPSFGVAIRINDKDSETEPTESWDFGTGVDGIPRTALFETVAFGSIPAGHTAIAWHNAILWNSNEPVELFVGSSNPRLSSIKTVYTGQTVQAVFPKAEGDFAFYKISLVPHLGRATCDFTLTAEADDKTQLCQTKVSPVIAPALFHAFDSRLDSLIQITTEPLLLRHLKSVRSITLTEIARALLYRADNPREANDVVQYVNTMYQGFGDDCGKWESYLSGKRSLIFSFISKRDQSVQFYTFTLPRNWNPEQAYPLFVELHGAGNPNPLSTTSALLSSGNARLDLFGYSDTRSYAQKEGFGYHLAPFGRGNSAYTDIGEIDVLEALSDVEANFNVDPDRRYLYGFSMGGAGTFWLGMLHPDYWAAVAVYAGAVRRALWYQPCVEHLGHLPKWVWCGEEDGLYPAFETMKTWFTDLPVKAEFHSSPGIGHSYNADWQKTGVEWLRQHTRTRPASFTYYCMDNRHISCWGISVEKDSGEPEIPWFSYSIENDKLIINTSSVKSLRIDTGKAGLNLSGTIRIEWNGRLIFEGEAGGIVEAH